MAARKKTSRKTSKRVPAKRTSRKSSRAARPIRLRISTTKDLTKALRLAWANTLLEAPSYRKLGRDKIVAEVIDSVKTRGGEATFSVEGRLIEGNESAAWDRLHHKAESKLRQMTGDKGYYFDQLNEGLYFVSHD
jgi:hypothetical protein